MRIATPSNLNEKQVCAIGRGEIIRRAEKEGHPIRMRRSEMVCTLPDCGQVYNDSAFELCDAPDQFGVIEGKTFFTKDLIEQIVRWLPYVNVAWIVYQQSGRPKPWMRREIHDLDRQGVGRVVIVDGIGSIAQAPVFHEVDTRLFAAAYFASDGSQDPEAGSAGVKRVTPTVAAWQDVRAYIRDFGPVTASDIRHAVAGRRRLTPAAIRKAVDLGELVNVTYAGIPAVFSWIGGSE